MHAVHELHDLGLGARIPHALEHFDRAGRSRLRLDACLLVHVDQAACLVVAGDRVLPADRYKVVPSGAYQVRVHDPEVLVNVHHLALLEDSLHQGVIRFLIHADELV